LATAAIQAEPFSFETVRARALELARSPHVPRATDDLPEWLAKLDYDGYRALRFVPQASLWGGEDLPFRAQFMHRGYLFRSRVRIHVVEGGEARELRFEPAQFQYAPGQAPVPDELGYAGFALRYRASEPARWDEFASFLGASYYRLVGSGQHYGASARGLAIDAATSKGEEFPEFVEFWIEKPAPDARQLVVHALLDSPSLTGACRFVLEPGAQTAADALVCIVPRRPVEKLGLAPLTSMFHFGEDGLRRTPDYRPEVHDSDGLLIHDARGEWLWRPLRNPPREHRVTRFALENPAGFGLLQRDRSFESYADLEARYELRPSLWVEPRGSWGKGAVELLEIPTPGEWNDNVVAYWVPEQALTAGQELRLEYRMTAATEEPARPPLLHARSARMRPGKEAQLFVLDFVGLEPGAAEPGNAAPSVAAPGQSPERSPMAATAPDASAQPSVPAAPLEARVSTPRGAIRHLTLRPNTPSGAVRCSFELVDGEPAPLELRVQLWRGERPVSETVVLSWERP
jgi:glucans biosynthesis protein